MDPEDLPPALEWETPIWQLWELVCRQWRRNARGIPDALDYNPAIALAEAQGWDMWLAMDMLQAIEAVMLDHVLSAIPAAPDPS